MISLDCISSPFLPFQLRTVILQRPCAPGTAFQFMRRGSPLRFSPIPVKNAESSPSQRVCRKSLCLRFAGLPSGSVTARVTIAMLHGGSFSEPS